MRLLCGVVLLGYITGIPKAVAQLTSSRPVFLLDQRNGLDNTENFFFLKDSRDFVWMCSNAGLYRYDGRNFRIFYPDDANARSLNPNSLHSFICEDSQSNLWFGTWQGVHCYHRADHTFTCYTPVGANLRYRYFVAGIDSVQQVWFTHAEGIYTLDTRDGGITRRSKFHAFLWNSELQFDAIGQVTHVYSYNRYVSNPGLYVHTFDQSQHIRTDSILIPEDGREMAVSDVHIVSDTTVLIASTDGLYHYNVQTRVSKLFRPLMYSGQWPVTAITPLSGSLFLIATGDGKYCTFDLATESFRDFHTIHTAEGQIMERPMTLYTDPDGGIWIYLSLHGVAYYHPQNIAFSHIPLSVPGAGGATPLIIQCLIEIDSNTVFASAESQGAFFFQVRNGLPSAVPSRCTYCPLNIKLAWRDSGKHLWMFVEGNLLMNDLDNGLQQIPLPGRARTEQYICELLDGRILLNTDQGVMVSNVATSHTPVFRPFNELDSSFDYHLTEIHPNGLLYSLVSRNEEAQFHLNAYDTRSDFTLVASYEMSTGVRYLQPVAHSDDFLMVTREGPYHYNAATDDLRFIDIAESQDGNIIPHGILPLENTRYLLCGANGVGILDLASGELRRFNAAQGLGDSGVSWHGFLRHSSGTIWLAYRGGLSFADARTLDIPQSIDSKVNITDIRVDHQMSLAQALKDTALLNPNVHDNIRLNYINNTISFRYAALSYAGPDHHAYEYRMVNLEDDWVADEGTGYARYAGLRSGKYEFQVRVRGQPNSLRAIGIDIIPPFYLTSWFAALIALLVVAMGFLLMRGREIRRQRLLRLEYEKKLALEHERLRISNNLHDDVGSGLSGLNLRTQFLSQRVRDPDLKEQVDQLAITTSQLVQQIRETIWTTSAEYDDVDNLITQIHQYSHEFFAHTGVDVQVHLPQTQIPDPIPGADRRELYLAFKEAIHNIVKHANASEVDIGISFLQTKQLIITIRDNGNGFVVSQVSSGLGLSSMRQRMDTVGGELHVDSTSKGTSIVLRYQIPSDNV